DLTSALGEGLALIRAAAARASATDRASLAAFGDRIERASAPDAAVAAATDPALATPMARYPDPTGTPWAEGELEVIVDPERARFAAWYEFFPRSGAAVDRSATFKEAEAQLTRAAAMGFDVVYLPPIHPIGRAHRKGRNNELVAAAGDPGSPWAIGSGGGGYTHDAPDPRQLDGFYRFF